MGRSKNYDREEMLEMARALFNERGFAGTSVGDLVDTLEINPKSLYAEFGSKQELFELALELHMKTNFARIVGPLESAEAGIAELRGAIEWWGGLARGSGAGIGCLLCNTASERSASDPGSRKYVKKYIKRLSNGFHNALSSAQTRGEIRETVDVQGEADFLTSHAIGQLTLVRSKAAPGVVESSARIALQHVASLATMDL